MDNLHTNAQREQPYGYHAGVSFDADALSSAPSYRDWEQHYLQLSAGAFEGKIEEVELEPLTVFRESSNRVVLQAGHSPQGVFALGSVLNMDGDAYFRGDLLRQRCMAMVDPMQEFELRTSESFEIIAVTFSPENLCAHLDDPEVDFRELEAKLMLAGKTFDRQNSAPLERFLFSLLEASRETPELLYREATTRTIAEEFYGLLNGCLAGAQHEVGAPVCENRSRVIKRLRAYLGSVLDSEIGIPDICREIGVTRRTLQNATQEILGVSPQNYLKAIRLNGVRRDLKQRHAGRETIADIAARWGFWHLSQLAQDYRRMFGELPSQTSGRVH